MDAMDGVSSLVEMVSDRLVLWCFMSARCSLKRVSRVRPVLADVEFGASGAKINVHDVARQAVELFGDVHLGFRSLDTDVGADEESHSAFFLVARNGSWCSVGSLLYFRSH